MTLDLARDSTAPARLWVALGHQGHPTPIPSLPSGADAVN